MTIPTIAITGAFPAAADTATYGFYDVSLYDGASANYAPDRFTQDLSPYLREDGWSVQRGTNSISSSYHQAQAGQFDAKFDNTDRRFDPTFASGPYLVGSVYEATPGVELTVTATYNAVTYPMIVTFVEGWPQTYPAWGRDQVIELTSSDALSLLGRAQIDVVLFADVTGPRITKALDVVGWSTSRRAIAPGTTKIARLDQSSVSLLSHMADVTEIEWGDLYAAKNGDITFRDRTAILVDTRSSVVQGVFGDAPGELRFADVSLGYDDTMIVNDVTITYTDTDLSVRAADTASQRKPWGIRSLNRPLPFYQPSDAASYAQWIVTHYGVPALRVNNVTIKPRFDPTNLFPQVLGRELGDLISVTLTPLGGGARITRKVFIRGISHAYSNHDWTTVFTLEDAEWLDMIGHYDVNSYDDGSVYAF